MKSERGAAMLLALIVVLMVGAVIAAIGTVSRAETMLARSFQQARQATYEAEGAIALAIRDLSALPDWSAVLSGAATSSYTEGAAIGTRQLAGGEIVTLCCDASSLTALVQQRAHGGRTWAGDTPEWHIFLWGPATSWLAAGRIRSADYVVVWVADDPEDGDANPAADKNGIVELYAQTLGPAGLRRNVQVLVRRQTIGDDDVPGPGVRVLSWREVRW